MSEFLTFMAAPAVGCLLLAVILTYFGIHVLRRGIIFVDLAMAQLAALGTLLSLAFGFGEDGIAGPLLSIFCVLSGSLMFTGVRNWFPRLSQEAFIGIVYVVSASMAIIIADKIPHAAEHIQRMLNGSILWITWWQVAQLAGVILILGWFLMKHHSRLETLTNNFKVSGNKKPNRLGWDFLFYLLLGLVIVFSIEKAGVFLIFSLLIIPAACANECTGKWGLQFVVGSLIGVFASWAGLALSYLIDLPTGSTIVTALGITLLAVMGITYTSRKLDS